MKKYGSPIGNHSLDVSKNTPEITHAARKSTIPQNEQSNLRETIQSRSKVHDDQIQYSPQLQNTDKNMFDVDDMANKGNPKGSKVKKKKKLIATENPSPVQSKTQNEYPDQDIELTNLVVGTQFQKQHFSGDNNKMPAKKKKKTVKIPNEEPSQSNKQTMKHQEFAGNSESQVDIPLSPNEYDRQMKKVHAMPVEDDNTMQPVNKPKKKKKKQNITDNDSKKQTQFIQSDMFMPADESTEYLMGQENSQLIHLQSQNIGFEETKKGKKSSKISSIQKNEKIKKSKTHNLLDEQPIKLNYSQQLQNGHLKQQEQVQQQKQIMLISKDVLFDQNADQVIEQKKKELKKGLGQKIKQMMRRDAGEASSQKKKKSKQEQEDKDDQQKQLLIDSTIINHDADIQKPILIEKSNKDGNLNQGDLNGINKPTDKGSDSKVQSKILDSPDPQSELTQDKPDEAKSKMKVEEIKSSNSSSFEETQDSSEEIDMENIDKDEYFKNLKKKQRKNFIISLKRNANEKNQHLAKIKRIEEHPRNILEIEDVVEEEQEYEKTSMMKFKTKISMCLVRNGCHKCQRKLFGHQYLDYSGSNQDEFGFKQRQDEFMKRQMQEQSDADKLLKKGILKLNNPIRVRWDVFIIFFTIYNCIELPIEVGFQWREMYDKDNVSSVANGIIDALFGIDIIMNFFTTFFHPTTGEEISDKKQIAKNYIRGMFFLDVMSTVPFDNLALLFFKGEDGDTQNLQVISMLKTIRVFRLSKLIAFLNATDEIKLHLQLIKTIFLIILYIHILACIWYAFSEQGTQMEWVPGQAMQPGKPNFFTDYDFPYRFWVSFYTSVLALNGNDIYPLQVPWQYILGSLYLLMGALMQAYMFGNLAVMVQQLNRKSQSFQEKLDLANTSMRNMLLQEGIQQEIRDFMTRTQSNLDNQKELNQFLMIISPSLRCHVTQHIFETAISQNSLFQDQREVMEFLINKITPRLKLPEDILCQQNDSHDKFLCFIARGKCEVSVGNNMRKNNKQLEIQPGDYFGEICLIYDCPRTATVQSLDYSIFAELTQEQFHDLWNYHPAFYDVMKNSIQRLYNDEWIEFKIKLLKQVDYFKKRIDMGDEKFFHEIQFFMQEKVFQRGNFIHEAGTRTNDLIFIVNGMVEVQVQDLYGDYHTLEQLVQGSHIFQYSIHSTLPTFLSLKAGSAVRLLTLSRKFFESFGLESELAKNFEIDGLEEACHRASKDIDKLRKHCTDPEMKKYCLPQCDFKLYERMVLKDPARKRTRHLNRAGNRARTLNKINRRDDKMKMKGLLNQIKQQQKKEMMMTENTDGQAIEDATGSFNQVQRNDSENNNQIPEIGQGQRVDTQQSLGALDPTGGSNAILGQIERKQTLFGQNKEDENGLLDLGGSQQKQVQVNPNQPKLATQSTQKLMNSKLDSRRANYLQNLAMVKMRIMMRKQFAQAKIKARQAQGDTSHNSINKTQTFHDKKRFSSVEISQMGLDRRKTLNKVHSVSISKNSQNEVSNELMSRMSVQHKPMTYQKKQSVVDSGLLKIN